MKDLTICPSTLKIGYKTYSPKAIKSIFGGKRVSHIADFSYDAENSSLVDSITKISVSGVQEKLSAIIYKGKIIPTPAGEQGRYIIKPIPDYKYLKYRSQLPANEHLTMQIARQAYSIPTAENGLIFLSDGTPAYITKRFDYGENGEKIAQEDFCSLWQKTVDSDGVNYKYTGSYLELATLLKHYTPAWRVEISKLFSIIVFNYIFSNGDAHLKNFSIQQTTSGDYLLSPSYDLLNTSIHVVDSDFALSGGLFPESEYSTIYSKTGHPCKDDFIHFANKIGVLPKHRDSIIEMYSIESSIVKELINNSFLDERSKRIYLRSYKERLQRFLRTDSERP